MDPRERGTYKKYLEPDSQDPIPKSTWYRLKKQRRMQVNMDCNFMNMWHCITIMSSLKTFISLQEAVGSSPASGSNDEVPIEAANSESSEIVPTPCIAERESTEVLTRVMQ